MVRPESPALFDQFWKEYPKKRGKIEAMKAWAKLKPTPEDLVMILLALEWQKRQDDWLKDGGQYIPYPASWLNGGRWDDEPVQPEEKPHAPTFSEMKAKRWAS